MDAEKRQGGWQTRRLAWLSWACRSLANIVGRQVARLDTQDCNARESASKAVRSERRSATFPEKDPQTRGADTRVRPQTHSILPRESACRHTRLCAAAQTRPRSCLPLAGRRVLGCWLLRSLALSSKAVARSCRQPRDMADHRHLRRTLIGGPPPYIADHHQQTTAQLVRQIRSLIAPALPLLQARKHVYSPPQVLYPQ